MKSSSLSAVFTLILVVGSQAAAAEPAKDARRVAQGICKSPDASILRRPAPDQPWQPIMQGQTVYSGDLLLGVPYAEIKLLSGVELDLVDNMDRRAPLPLVETAIVLNNNKERDLDVTLDRGWIGVANDKASGPAKITVRFRDQAWDLRLDPDARISMEVFGRWPKGIPFTTKPGPDDVPALDVILLVLEGKVLLSAEGHHFAMRAPPGASLLHWNNVHGMERPRRMTKLPPWAAPEDFSQTPEGRKRKASVAMLRKLILDKSVAHAVDVFLKSPDDRLREASINIMGATDDLPRLGQALLETKNIELWDHAVIALRHWLGRCPGQDQKMYELLVKKREFKPGEAAIVLELLRSFGDDITSCPECYETLIEYIKSDKMAIRGLAQWHLHRLVPAGKDIKFNPAGPEEARDEAYKQWKKLIPDGKLPPVVEPEKDELDETKKKK